MRNLSIGTLLVVVAVMYPAGPAAPQDTFTILGSWDGAWAPGTKVLGFASESDARDELTEVLRYSGLRTHFVFRRDDSVGDNIAVATMVAGPVGGEVRAIFYSAPHMQDIRRRSGTDWSLRMVLAHEVGHHVQGHVLSGSPIGYRDAQLEADEYAGFVLYRMGAELDEAQSAVATFPRGSDPSPRDRMRAVARGWREARRQMPGSGSGSSSPPSPSGPPTGTSSPSAGAQAAREAIVRLEQALGNQLGQVEEIIRNDLARLNADLASMSADLKSTLAASEAKVIGAVAAGLEANAEAIKAAVAEEAESTREAVAAEGLLTRETVVAESAQTREDVGRVMWLLVAFGVLALPMLMVLTFRKPRQQLVRVVERASTTARSRLQSRSRASRIQRDSHGVPQVPRRRAPASAPRQTRPPERRMTAAASALTLVPGGAGRDIVVSERHLQPGGGGFLIGRHAPAVHAVVDDPTVSRTHARIALEAGRLVIEDLGSSNGTRVNGAWLRQGEKRVLASGDSVQFGGMAAFSVRKT